MADWAVCGCQGLSILPYGAQGLSPTLTKSRPVHTHPWPVLPPHVEGGVTTHATKRYTQKRL